MLLPNKAGNLHAPRRLCCSCGGVGRLCSCEKLSLHLSLYTKLMMIVNMMCFCLFLQDKYYVQTGVLELACLCSFKHKIL